MSSEFLTHDDLSENLRCFKQVRQEEDISTLKIQSGGMWSTEAVLLLELKTTTTSPQNNPTPQKRNSGL